MILGAALLALCMSAAFTGCGSKNGDSKTENQPAATAESKAESKSESGSKSENAGSTCAYNCPDAGFGFDLPENMKLTKGFLYMNDLGDLDYDSGVMMGWPVYRQLYTAS